MKTWEIIWVRWLFEWDLFEHHIGKKRESIYNCVISFFVSRLTDEYFQVFTFNKWHCSRAECQVFAHEIVSVSAFVSKEMINYYIWPFAIQKNQIFLLLHLNVFILFLCAHTFFRKGIKKKVFKINLLLNDNSKKDVIELSERQNDGKTIIFIDAEIA